MDHRALQCFVALAEELHFGRAARRAHIGQPGLSGQIRRLEGLVGTKLVSRSSRRVALTPAGEQLLGPARKALAALDAFRAEARALSGAQGAALVVGCTSIAAFWGAHRLINAFAGQHPKLVVEVREMTSVEQEAALVAGEIDAGFLHPPFEAPLDYIQIGSDPLIAAVARASVDAGRNALSLHEIAARPLILFPRSKGPHLYARVMEAFAAQGLRPRLAKFANPFTVGIGAAADGRGIAIVTSSYRGHRADEVAYRPIVDLDVSVPIALAWRTAQAGSWTERFVNAIRFAIAVRNQSHGAIDQAEYTIGPTETAAPASGDLQPPERPDP